MYLHQIVKKHSKLYSCRVCLAVYISICPRQASQLQHPVPAIAANLHLRALNPHIAEEHCRAQSLRRVAVDCCARCEDTHDFAALFPNCSVAGKVLANSDSEGNK